jgi:hypothetical protein
MLSSNSAAVTAAEGRWVVTVNGQVSLHTAGQKPADWAKVEQHVRHAMGQQTPAEQLACAMHSVVEQLGTEHPVGAQLYGALIQAGLD